MALPAYTRQIKEILYRDLSMITNLQQPVLAQEDKDAWTQSILL